MKNIIETALGNPDFSTLVTAVKKAELVDTLSGTGPFTVFAPNNAAFSKIPKEKLDTLLGDKDKLTTLLTQHVVAEKIMSEKIAKLTELDTLAKSKLKVSAHNGVMINNAKVVAADIECSNGVIHAIDTVLM